MSDATSDFGTRATAHIPAPWFEEPQERHSGAMGYRPWRHDAFYGLVWPYFVSVLAAAFFTKPQEGMEVANIWPPIVAAIFPSLSLISPLGRLSAMFTTLHDSRWRRVWVALGLGGAAATGALLLFVIHLFFWNHPDDFLDAMVGNSLLVMSGSSAWVGLLQAFKAVLELSKAPVSAPRSIERDVNVGSALRLARIVHWSDLHITPEASDFVMESPRKVHGGNAMLAKIIAQNKASIADASALIVTGDITDSGRALEWRAFFDLMPQELCARCVLVPGNHDINITDPTNHFLMEGEDSIPRKVRIVRMLAAMDQIQGERALVLRGGELVSLREVLRPHWADLKRFTAAPPVRTFRYRGRNMIEEETTSKEDRALLELPSNVWDSAFPQVIEIVKDKVAAIVINSVDDSRHVAGNAFGRVDRGQLAVLGELFSRYPAHAILVCLHHHVALPEKAESLFGSVQLRAMRLVNARELISAFPADRKIGVLHRHRHYAYSGWASDSVKVISACSTTLGDEATSISGGRFQFVTVCSGASGVDIDLEWSDSSGTELASALG